ncbi:MAG: hypothetical protein LC797_07630 [Chloroflexi bacterium]|nr:hypothetical protein [Chloroflexota bacterium]
MNTLTRHSVVDGMTADLAERRLTTIKRNAAYVALARAIVSDETIAMPVQRAFIERLPTPIRTALAA